MGASPCLSAIFMMGENYGGFPGQCSLSKMGSTLKGKNLLHEEQFFPIGVFPH